MITIGALNAIFQLACFLYLLKVKYAEYPPLRPPHRYIIMQLFAFCLSIAMLINVSVQH
jgi:hypothetical protein